MTRRELFSLLPVLLIKVPDARRQRLDKAQVIARGWAEKHVILRPWTGQVFVSPSNGMCREDDDYIEVGSIRGENA